MAGLTIGVIGVGRIGEYHAGVLAGLPGVGALLLADVVEGRAAEVARGIDLASATDIDSALAGADAILIASSTDTHAELLHAVAELGKPAFCEKPIAVDLEATRGVVAALDAAGVTVQMGFQRRYDPAIRAIRDRVVAGELGTLYLVRSQTHDPAPPPFDYIPHSGGIFRDCLIHDIDIVRYVTGQEVVTVRAVGAVLGFPEIGEHGDVDSAAVLVELSEGTLGQLSGLRHDAVGYDVRLEVFGSGDSVAAGWSPRSPIRSTEPGVPGPADPITTFWDRFDAAYRAELEGFLRVVAGDEEPAATPADAYEDLRVAAACDLSLRESRTVALEEIA